MYVCIYIYVCMYNYVYEVTNVPYPQFTEGIILDWIKRHLLDSYLGVFGKQIFDGNASTLGGGVEEALLLIALRASVLIRVFASQLANETWNLINGEIEIEKAERSRAAAVVGGDSDDTAGGGEDRGDTLNSPTQPWRRRQHGGVGRSAAAA